MSVQGQYLVELVVVLCLMMGFIIGCVLLANWINWRNLERRRKAELEYLRQRNELLAATKEDDLKPDIPKTRQERNKELIDKYMK